jgi:hypothetical protein
MSKMGSHDPFGHLQHKLWQKGRPKVKLTVWLSTTKCRELTWLPCVQVACDTSLESSWRDLQLWFKPRPNWRFEHEVITPQSYRNSSLALVISGLLFESLTTKSHLDVASTERCRVYYMGEGGGFPQVRAVVSLVSPKFSWLVLAPKVLQHSTNHVLVVLMQIWVSN